MESELKIQERLARLERAIKKCEDRLPLKVTDLGGMAFMAQYHELIGAMMVLRWVLETHHGPQRLSISHTRRIIARTKP